MNVCLHFFSFFSVLCYCVFSCGLYERCNSNTLILSLSSLWWCQWAVPSSGCLSALPSLACERGRSGGVEDRWCCVHCAILLNKHQSENTDRNSRLRRSAFTSPSVIMNWCWISARTLSINHIPLLRNTGLAPDQLAEVKPMNVLFFSTGLQPELSHPPLSDNRLIYGSKEKNPLHMVSFCLFGSFGLFLSSLASHDTLGYPLDQFTRSGFGLIGNVI